MKDLVKKIHFLGYFQAIGGLLGFLLTVIDIITNNSVPIRTYIGSLVFGFSLYCGYCLLSEKYESGLKLSLVNQFMQVLSFSVFGLSYGYISSLGLILIFDVTQDIIFNLQIRFIEFELFTGNPSTYIGVNLASIIFINYIFKWQKKLEINNNRKVK